MSNSPNRFVNHGLLLMRIGIGIFYIFHGYPKLFDGPERWEALGAATEALGIGFLPVFWGFMAAIAETFGGIFILLGLFFRPATTLLFITMFVATLFHIHTGDPFMTISHSGKMAIIFMSLFLTGPGKFSLDHKINKRRR
jgi:putative oxidoreductase